MKAGLFKPQADFAADGEYRLLPFRFLRQEDGVFLTNEVGEYEFVSTNDFDALVSGRLGQSETYNSLKAKHFLADGDLSVPLRLLATKVRSKRDFTSGFTRLHIFVVSLRCDHTCAYCQVSRVTENRQRFDLSAEMASRALDLVFRSPAKELKIEFQGGEPTLNWERVEQVVSLAATRAAHERRVVEFVVATNLSNVSPEILEFCRQYRIHLSTSLDGPPALHNANRPRPGRDSYERFRRNLELARAVLGADQVSALMTTTPRSLEMARAIIDEYVALSFDSIFLRPISPYGFANRTGLAGAYGSREFLAFYREGLEYIISLNRAGTKCVETYAQLLLRKILTPFSVGYVDLQSPAALGTGVVVYNYDGGVYASDESRMLAEMGDQSFRLGHVNDSYEELFGSSKLRTLVQASCLETMPGCSECAYLPYCGSDPVQNWATQEDPVGHRPTSEFCSRQMGMFQLIFGLLRNGDSFTQSLLRSWAAA